MCGKTLEYELENHDVHAFLGVSNFGFCKDLSEIEKLASRFNIPLIVDTAAAFGGMINKNKKVG